MAGKLTTGGWIEVKDYSTLASLNFEPQGPRHVPVPHDYAIEFFKNSLLEHNIEIIREKAVLSPDTMKLMFLADVRPNKKAEKDFIFSVGFINNNDRTRAFTGIAGTTVYINNAQWFVSDDSYKTRHTTTVREMLAERSAHIITWFNEYYQQQSGMIETMKNTKCTDKHVGELILRYIREKYILGSTNIKRIVDEWDNPRHDEFKPRTLWSLQNACAEVFKKIKSPMFRLQAMEVFTEHFADILEK
jgi:hypothetical protein